MSPILTSDMKRLVDEQRLGFVATVDPDGSPNLSPKATFSVIDDHTIGYCEIRSPRTMSNIARGSAIEVNFVDPFTRKGCRFKGRAEVIARGSAGFDDTAKHFSKHGSIADRARSIVVIRIDRALPLVSPAYDGGQVEESDIRRLWTKRFREIQPGRRYEE